MARKHVLGDCSLPSGLSPKRSWTCPGCGNVWSATPKDQVSVPWFGERRSHIRNPDGSKLSWWQ
jgi:hypothetical protein